MLTVIGHSDLISNFTGDLRYLTIPEPKAQVSMKALKSLRPLVVLASLCPFEMRDGRDHLMKTTDVWQRWLGFRTSVETTPSFVLLESLKALQPDETEKIQLILHLEGAEPLEKPDHLEQFYLFGGRAIALTWNHQNQYAGGALSDGTLTREGKELLRHAAELKLAIDISHLNEKSFWQVLESFDGAIFASHSNARELADSPRNLTRRQLSALRERRAWVGVSFARSHLTTHSQSTIDDVVAHCDYLAEHLGFDLVGLGTDFGGIISGTPRGLETLDRLPHLFVLLEQRGWTNGHIEGLRGENFFQFTHRTHSA